MENIKAFANFGINVFGANQYIAPFVKMEVVIKPSRFHVKKLKKVQYMGFSTTLLLFFILWVPFLIYCCFLVWPMQSICVTILMLTSISFASLLSRK